MIEHPLQAALPGHESIRRVWQHRHQCYGARIMPGEYYVTRNDELIATTLGSCIAACVRDPFAGIGGMNHFMLPADEREDATATDQSARYGNVAMAQLISDILRHGGRRERLEVKIFGGGNVMPSMTMVGSINTAFIREYLQEQGFTIAAEDLGGSTPRKVIYFPATGRVMMQRVKLSQHDQTEITRLEAAYQQSLIAQPTL